jgi:hypothetical protein
MNFNEKSYFYTSTPFSLEKAINKEAEEKTAYNN